MPRIDRLTAETRFFQVQAPAQNETRPGGLLTVISLDLYLQLCRLEREPPIFYGKVENTLVPCVYELGQQLGGGKKKTGARLERNDRYRS